MEIRRFQSEDAKEMVQAIAVSLYIDFRLTSKEYKYIIGVSTN